MTFRFCKRTSVLAVFATFYLLTAPISRGAEPAIQPLTANGSQKVSIDVKDTDVRELLRSLAKQGNLNIALTEKVQGTITLRLQDVSIDSALEAVVETARLVSRRTKDLILIMTEDEVPALIKETIVREKLQATLIPFQFANAGAAQEALKAQLSPYGNVTLDKDANALIIADNPANLNALVGIANGIDIVPPQFVIDVFIAETISRDQNDRGVNLQLSRTTANSSTTIDQNLILPVGGTEGGSFSYQILTGKWTTDNVVRVLQTIDNTRILATPRILVLNGKEAMIQTIDELPYRQLTETSQGGQIGTVAFKEVGVTLRVTPMLTKDKRIVLHMQAEQSAPTGRFIDEIPIITTRKADTIIVLDDGAAVVLGGLKRKETSKTVRQVPYLGNIPVLGWLFRYTTTVDEYKDLVIFMTPRLFDPTQPQEPRPSIE